jgi:hypothetical protein
MGEIKMLDLQNAMVDLRLRYDVEDIGNGMCQVCERGTGRLVATIRPVTAARVHWSDRPAADVQAAIVGNGLWVV